MTHRRRLVVLAALLSMSAVVAGSAGFSATTAGRGVQVAVADDDAAYLGVERITSGTANGTTNLTVTVSNQFPAGTSLTTVAVSADGQTTDLAASGALDAGDSATVTFTDVACTASLTVNASGSDVAVALARAIQCE